MTPSLLDFRGILHRIKLRALVVASLLFASEFATAAQTVSVTASGNRVSAITVNGVNLVSSPFTVALYDHTFAWNDYSNPVSISTQVTVQGADTVQFVVTATMPTSNPHIASRGSYFVKSLEIQFPPLLVTVPAIGTTDSNWGGGGDVPVLDESTPNFEWFYLDGNYPITGSAWQTSKKQWTLRVGSSNGGPMPASGYNYNSWAGGQQYTWTFAYRFADSGTDVYGANAALVNEWVQANAPYAQRWLNPAGASDNRPIGLFASCSNPTATNPAGWNEGDPTIDVTAPDFASVLQTKLTALVNQCITNMQSIYGQGFVWWDYCGDPEFPGCMYVGDPRVLPRMQPVLNGFIDTLFANIRNSGLTPGICIRDDDVYYSTDHWTCVNYPNEATRLAQLSAKIRYAYNRWAKGGKFIIYLDSWQGSLDTLQRLSHANPNVLIMPEMQYPAPFAYLYAAPFSMVNLFRESSPSALKPFIPWCKQFSYCGNESATDPSLPGAIEGIQSGDLLGLRAWWPGGFDWTGVLPEVQGSWDAFFAADRLTVPQYDSPVKPRVVSEGVGAKKTKASILESNAAGQSVTYLLPNVASGNYDVRVGVKEANSRGQWQLSAGEADDFPGTASSIGIVQDEYNPSAAAQEYDLGTWSPTTNGDHWFQFTVTGKNSRSTNYRECFDYIRLIPREEQPNNLP